ncbi:hypothetical protein Ciccas_009822 [Cichlidogyrus casuarinus]|uniref:Frizzled/Smoothened 7TM domain-containing protein n=1 Tax=Cichlidogyrus casuarinus TaxID=1844966 RepID=A0ABD2PVW5_9PLAT
MSTICWWLTFTITWTQLVLCYSRIRSSPGAGSNNKRYQSRKWSALQHMSHWLIKLLANCTSRSNKKPKHKRNVWQHVLAWTPAGLLTAAVLVFRGVQSDYFTGLCRVIAFNNEHIFGPNNTFSRANLFLASSVLPPSVALLAVLLLLTVTTSFLTAVVERQQTNDTFATDRQGLILYDAVSSAFLTDNQMFIQRETSTKPEEIRSIELNALRPSLRPTVICWMGILLVFTSLFRHLYEFKAWPRWLLSEESQLAEMLTISWLGFFSDLGFGLLILGWSMRPANFRFWLGYLGMLLRKRTHHYQNQMATPQEKALSLVKSLPQSESGVIAPRSIASDYSVIQGMESRSCTILSGLV